MKKIRPPVKRVVRIVTLDALHAWTHVLLGVVWLYFVSIFIPYAMSRYIWIAVIGSLLPDTEHLLYVFLMKRNAPYSKAIKQFLWKKQIKNMVTFIRQNHKEKIYLPLHHFMMPVLFVIVAFVAYTGQKEGMLVFLGAIASHYIYDMFDDLLYLGRLNPNWTRGMKSFLIHYRRK